MKEGWGIEEPGEESESYDARLACLAAAQGMPAAEMDRMLAIYASVEHLPKSEVLARLLAILQKPWPTPPATGQQQDNHHKKEE